MAEFDTVFTVGGEQIVVPKMNFGAFKRAWPHIKQLPSLKDDRIEMASCYVRILSAALWDTRPELTPDAIEAKLSIDESEGLGLSMVALYRNAGLMPGETVPPAGSQPDPAAETSTATGEG